LGTPWLPTGNIAAHNNSRAPYPTLGAPQHTIGAPQLATLNGHDMDKLAIDHAML